MRIWYNICNKHSANLFLNKVNIMDKTAIEIIIFGIIFFALFFFFFNRMIKRNYIKESKAEETENEFTINTSKGIIILYVFSWAILAMVMYLAASQAYNEGKMGLVYFFSVFFVVFILMAIIPFITLRLWKIVVSGNEVEYTSYFGKKKTFIFSDITKAVYRRQRQATYVRGRGVKTVMSYGVVDIYVGDKKMVTLSLAAKTLFSL